MPNNPSTFSEFQVGHVIYRFWNFGDETDCEMIEWETDFLIDSFTVNHATGEIESTLEAVREMGW